MKYLYEAETRIFCEQYVNICRLNCWITESANQLFFRRYFNNNNNFCNSYFVVVIGKVCKQFFMLLDGKLTTVSKK